MGIKNLSRNQKIIIIVLAVVFISIILLLVRGMFAKEQIVSLPNRELPIVQPARSAEPVEVEEDEVEAEVETSTPSNDVDDFNQYIGDWYGTLPSREPGSKFYYAVHVHIDSVDIGENHTYLKGNVSHSPYLAIQDDFIESPIKYRWISSDKLFTNDFINSIAVTKSAPDTAVFYSEYYRNPTEKAWKFTLKRMNIDDIEKEKQKFIEEFITKAPKDEDKIPDFIKGTWRGVIPYEGDYMGFRFKFNNVNGNKADGIVTQVENKGENPDYTYGVDYRFTATLDEKRGALIIKWSDGNFYFDITGEDSARYVSQYGDVHLAKD